MPTYQVKSVDHISEVKFKIGGHLEAAASIFKTESICILNGLPLAKGGVASYDSINECPLLKLSTVKPGQYLDGRPLQEMLHQNYVAHCMKIFVVNLLSPSSMQFYSALALLFCLTPV